MSEARSGKRLGRGLEALLGPISKEEAKASGALREVPLDQISPNPFQPRREFDPAAMKELVDSIGASGLLQPPVVRSVGSRYELIAGERRFRAVQQLGWKAVPVVVREVDDQAALSLALIENLQRDDLTSLDAALGYQRLMGEFGLPQSEVARLVGRDRSTVANTLRLLKLPADVQRLVQTRELSEGHARALLALDSPAEMIRLARRAVAEGSSVREIEAQVRGGEDRTGARGSVEHAQLVDLADLERWSRLPVRASVQPAHLLDDRETTERCWPEQTHRTFTLRSFLDAGIELALGSDAPVSPLDPWLAMAAAVHRGADDEPSWHPEQRISPREALAASVDGRRVRPGAPGDLALLDLDPLPEDGSGTTSSEQAARLRAMTVSATVLDGQVVHGG